MPAASAGKHSLDVFAAVVALLIWSGCATDSAQVYFGCGCFWYMQHGFVLLEQSLLNRSGQELEARTAYAGGNDSASRLVCYHDGGVATDYGRLGHAEVVALNVPRIDFGAFAARFWELCPLGERRDFYDVGGEYRSVVGLPGGIKSELMPELLQHAGSTTVVEGRGSDGDTLNNNTVFVYDTTPFQAHIAEKYLQFHDDTIDKYGPAYNDMRKFAAKTACPGDQSAVVV